VSQCNNSIIKAILHGSDFNRINKGGLYLARNMDCEWWNLIIQIDGKVPYLRCYVIINRGPLLARALNGDKFNMGYKISNPESIWWGPKIEEPVVLNDY